MREYDVQGMRAILLENEQLRIGILADKGTDVFELLYKPRDVDFVWRSTNGVQNPLVYAASNSSRRCSALASLDEARGLIRASFDPAVYELRDSAAWREARERLEDIAAAARSHEEVEV